MGIRRRAPALLALLLLASACGGSDAGSSEDWGPLAVISDEGMAGGQESGGSGTLRIGEECVTMQPPDDPPVTLVWPSGLTEWDGATRAILFDTGAGEQRLSDRDLIRIGGSGEVNAEWVAPPADSCPGRRFIVYEVQVAR